MGAKVSRTDFDWAYTEEPHASRRKEILGKYPEIKKLMVVDKVFKFKVVALVLLQLGLTVFATTLSWPLLILTTYIVSGTFNHALLLAIHETAHNMAFGHAKPMLNRIFGLFVNLPIGVPCATSFKKYHLDHHKYQGNEEIDVDLPTEFEAKIFFNTFTKFVWVVFQSLFYSLRPLIVRPQAATTLEILNVIIQFGFDIVVGYFFGSKALFYMIVGSLLGMGLHPVAGHFISEHYMFKEGFETYSYYGWLNNLTWNVGYHNEHHDFPSVPGSLLPKVREMAPEYYNSLPYHTSWVKVLFDFIVDPAIGPYARVKRKAHADKFCKPTPKQEENSLDKND